MMPIVMPIADLWDSVDPAAWERALERYWDFVQEKNQELEKALDPLNLSEIEEFNPEEWFDFLKDKYFRWKYTAPNRYATTTRHLERHKDNNKLGDLDKIRKRLLHLDPEDIRTGLETARGIHGLGPAGASGLLALMYPQNFGTVDQFVVKALRQVNGLPEAADFARMKPENLSIGDGVLIINVLRRKAGDNNRTFKSDTWTPRKLDKVLWTYGR